MPTQYRAMLGPQAMGISPAYAAGRRTPTPVSSFISRPAMEPPAPTEPPSPVATTPVATTAGGMAPEGPNLRAPENAFEQHVADAMMGSVTGLGKASAAKAGLAASVAAMLGLPSNMLGDVALQTGFPGPVSALTTIGDIATKGIASNRVNNAYGDVLSMPDETFQEMEDTYSVDLPSPAYSPTQTAAHQAVRQGIQEFDRLSANPWRAMVGKVQGPSSQFGPEPQAPADLGDREPGFGTGVIGGGVGPSGPAGYGGYGGVRGSRGVVGGGVGPNGPAGYGGDFGDHGLAGGQYGRSGYAGGVGGFGPNGPAGFGGYGDMGGSGDVGGYGDPGTAGDVGGGGYGGDLW